MSRISIDRELLQDLLDAYFYMAAENRAYLGMAQSANLKHPAMGRQYFDQHERETEKELSQTEGERNGLIDLLLAQDDDAFLSVLRSKIDLRPRAPKKSRKQSPR